ncbi:hypothetical protein RESH_00981 [Rhodopirellula europaea SH398]|uniref:Uncharacterized protein n=1 Tax=Rhodopirellula europaea SH398 TaxID=1263868 RepID=M5SL23_9BACT|nr:hypothetical protein RESH_00981 [Rhodopirellula europaea SH398]
MASIAAVNWRRRPAHVRRGEQASLSGSALSAKGHEPVRLGPCKQGSHPGERPHAYGCPGRSSLGGIGS